MGAFQAQYFYGFTHPVDLTAGGGGYAAGEVVPQVTNCLIVHVSIEPNKLGAASAEGGVYVIDKVSGDTFAKGAKVYWDNTNKRAATTDATGTNKFLGYAEIAYGAGTTTMKVVHAQA